MDLSTLVYEEDYVDSKENKSEEILDSIRNELEECIKLKRQFPNFEQIPENIKISLLKIKKTGESMLNLLQMKIYLKNWLKTLNITIMLLFSN